MPRGATRTIPNVALFADDPDTGVSSIGRGLVQSVGRSIIQTADPAFYLSSNVG